MKFNRITFRLIIYLNSGTYPQQLLGLLLPIDANFFLQGLIPCLENVSLTLKFGHILPKQHITSIAKIIVIKIFYYFTL